MEDYPWEGWRIDFYATDKELGERFINDTSATNADIVIPRVGEEIYMRDKTDKESENVLPKVYKVTKVRYNYETHHIFVYVQLVPTMEQ